MTRGILVPPLGMEPMSPALEVRSLNHWNTREVPPLAVLSVTLATPTPTEQVGGRRIKEGFAIRQSWVSGWTLGSDSSQSFALSQL